MSDDTLECVHGRHVLSCFCVQQERADLIDANEKLHARVAELGKALGDVDALADGEASVYQARIAELEAFARSVRDGFDHDEDAHRYNTFCRVCEAEKTLGRADSVSTGAALPPPVSYAQLADWLEESALDAVAFAQSEAEDIGHAAAILRNASGVLGEPAGSAEVERASIVRFLRAMGDKWKPVAEGIPCIASVNASIHCNALHQGANAIEAGMHAAATPTGSTEPACECGARTYAWCQRPGGQAYHGCSECGAERPLPRRGAFT